MEMAPRPLFGTFYSGARLVEVFENERALRQSAELSGMQETSVASSSARTKMQHQMS